MSLRLLLVLPLLHGATAVTDSHGPVMSCPGGVAPTVSQLDNLERWLDCGDEDKKVCVNKFCKENWCLQVPRCNDGGGGKCEGVLINGGTQWCCQSQCCEPPPGKSPAPTPAPTKSASKCPPGSATKEPIVVTMHHGCPKDDTTCVDAQDFLCRQQMLQMPCAHDGTKEYRTYREPLRTSGWWRPVQKGDCPPGEICCKIMCCPNSDPTRSPVTQPPVPVPSVAPTTRAPTKKPTADPTSQPTKNPSLSPTAICGPKAQRITVGPFTNHPNPCDPKQDKRYPLCDKYVDICNAWAAEAKTDSIPECINSALTEGVPTVTPEGEACCYLVCCGTTSPSAAPTKAPTTCIPDQCADGSNPQILIIMPHETCSSAATSADFPCPALQKECEAYAAIHAKISCGDVGAQTTICPVNAMKKGALYRDNSDTKEYSDTGLLKVSGDGEWTVAARCDISCCK